jgi:EAL domain-containing protein (putative c-di-GMP-specific phosphodiesterase class I)
MARSLRVEPLAEGVECAVQRDMLSQQGFRLMQGYLFGKPMPEPEFSASLAARWPASQRLTIAPVATA